MSASSWGRTGLPDDLYDAWSARRGRVSVPPSASERIHDGEFTVFVPLAWLKASRRTMRRHQQLPDRGARTPMWRLVVGELVWAAQQVWSCPWVAFGLAGGVVATLAVLGAAAPGPTLRSPWRLLVSLVAGWVVAAAARGAEGLWADRRRQQRTGDRPMLGASELCGVLVAGVLVVWLGAWGSQWLLSV